jgi:hypothetical protein
MAEALFSGARTHEFNPDRSVITGVTLANS